MERRTKKRTARYADAFEQKWRLLPQPLRNLIDVDILLALNGNCPCQAANAGQVLKMFGRHFVIACADDEDDDHVLLLLDFALQIEGPDPPDRGVEMSLPRPPSDGDQSEALSSHDLNVIWTDKMEKMYRTRLRIASVMSGILAMHCMAVAGSVHASTTALVDARNTALEAGGTNGLWPKAVTVFEESLAARNADASDDGPGLRSRLHMLASRIGEFADNGGFMPALTLLGGHVTPNWIVVHATGYGPRNIMIDGRAASTCAFMAGGGETGDTDGLLPALARLDGSESDLLPGGMPIVDRGGLTKGPGLEGIA